MTQKSSIKKIVELSIFPIAILIINIFFADNPAFLKGFFNPYFIFVLITAAQYGKYAALVTIFFSLFLILVPLPLLLGLIHKMPLKVDFWLKIANQGAIPFSATLVVSFIIGVIHDANMEKASKVKVMLKKVSRGKGLIQKELRAIKIVNNELEKRVLTQKDSIIALYSRIQKLFNSNFKKSLEIIIDIVRTFTDASSCSIWEYNQSDKRLNLLLEYGWNINKKQLTTIEADNSIEGWVVRNNTMFTAKMIMQYENLKNMDVGRNIFTVPILAGHKVWGVLNIEKLPFEKYNLYTEKILLIIMALISPSLERTIEYEALNIQETVDPVTGLPLFSQFYAILEKEINRLKREKGTLSIVILELINFENIKKEVDKKNIYQLLLLLSETVTVLSENKTIFFHYKSENQLCFLYPNLDFDGCSLFSLNMLEMINSKEWVLFDKIIHPEVILGYASLGTKELGAEDLINLAENLLDMQKV